MRTSIPSVPPLPNVRHRTQLPTFQHDQYAAIPPPQSFISHFNQQEGTIKWNNPNPFASTSNNNSPGQHGSQLPQLGHGDTTSSSSCSAPSPPPELEISPLDPVPGTETFDMNMTSRPPSNMAYAIDSHDVQPFDLGIFKKSLDFSNIPNYHTGGRQRGLSVLYDPIVTNTAHASTSDSTNSYAPLSGPFADYNTHNDQGYLRALAASNIPVGIPAHEEIMEGFA